MTWSRSPAALRRTLLLGGLGLLAACEARVDPRREAAAGEASGVGGSPVASSPQKPEKVVKSEAEWRKQLTPEQYRVLREKGTERPGSGEYEHETRAGVYRCAACGLALFRSDAKFDSGCGWPAFFEPLEGAHVTETLDTSHGMVRTEITCSRCGSHLGHVFDDEPTKTGLRYCVNSVSLDLEPDGERKTAPADGAKKGETAR
jgi:peptide-methionine (R)-S-oxide reductase